MIVRVILTMISLTRFQASQFPVLRAIPHLLSMLTPNMLQTMRTPMIVVLRVNNLLNSQLLSLTYSPKMLIGKLIRVSIMVPILPMLALLDLLMISWLRLQLEPRKLNYLSR